MNDSRFLRIKSVKRRLRKDDLVSGETLNKVCPSNASKSHSHCSAVACEDLSLVHEPDKRRREAVKEIVTWNINAVTFFDVAVCVKWVLFRSCTKYEFTTCNVRP
jgi:hypothetical protein